MSEMLTITRENARKAYDAAKKSGQEMLENLFGKKTFQKSVFERINGWEDILEEKGLTQEEFDQEMGGRPESQVRVAQMEMIAEVYNEGWVADRHDGNQKKWFPYYLFSGSGVSFRDSFFDRGFSLVGSRLYLKDEKTSNHVGKLFIEIYSKW